MRLIDADELIKQLQKERANGFPANENLSFYAMSSVNHAPTAYNVDNVVEELDKYITQIVGRNSKLYTTVIEIVKRGGVNDR